MALRLGLEGSDVVEIANQGLEEMPLELEQVIHVDLSDNRLQVLENLQELPRLVTVNVSMNQMLEYRTELGPMQGVSSTLEAIDLSDNCISSMDTLLPLKDVPSLQRLWLKGNPIGAQNSYRQRVIAMLPQLSLLDDVEVTREERDYRPPESVVSPAKHNGESLTSARTPRTASFKSEFINEKAVISPSIPEHVNSPRNSRRSSLNGELLGERTNSPRVMSEHVISPRSSREASYNVFSEKANLVHSPDPVSVRSEHAFTESLLSSPISSRTDLVSSRMTSPALKPVENTDVSNLRAIIERLEHDLEMQKHEMTRMRAYYNTALENDTPLSQRRETLRQSTEEIGLLQEQVRLRDAQISALRKMLKFEEKTRSEDSDSGMSEEERLLRGWQAKVYQLLVQLNASELHTEISARMHRAQIEEKEEICQRLQHELDIARQLEQSQRNDNAILQTRFRSLEAALMQKQDEKKRVEMQLKNVEASRVLVGDMLLKLKGELSRNDSYFLSSLSRLAGFEKRLSFALSRLAICKNMFISKESSWKEALDRTRRSSFVNSSAIEPPAILSEEEPLFEALHREISLLSNERSQLIEKITEARRNSRVEAEAEVSRAESKLVEANNSISKLAAELKKAKEQIDRHVQTISELKADLDEKKEQVAGSNKFIKDIEKRLRKEFSEERREVETRLMEQLREAESSRDTLLEGSRELKRENHEFASTIRHLERRILQRDSKIEEEAQHRVTTLELEIQRLKDRLSEIESEKAELVTKLQAAEDRVRLEIAARRNAEIEMRKAFEREERMAAQTLAAEASERQRVAHEAKLDVTVASIASSDTDLAEELGPSTVSERLRHVIELSSSLLLEDSDEDY